MGTEEKHIGEDVSVTIYRSLAGDEIGLSVRDGFTGDWALTTMTPDRARQVAEALLAGIRRVVGPDLV
jgi:hypothetical protein